MAVTRNATTLFNSTAFRLLMKSRFLELSTSLPATATVFGLGERTASLAVPRGPTPRALYARDAAAYVRDQNLYGAWPLAIVVDEDGDAFGLLIASAAPMDVVTQTDSFTIRLLAPTATILILGGPTVAAVLDAATRVTGRPALPPAWALGAMQSKWGWGSVDEVEASVAGYDAENIPLDTVFADIDYMSAHRDFTFNETAYPLPRVRAFVDVLHAAGRHWVPILDPGIPAVPGFAPYDAGAVAGVFVRAPPPASLETPYIGTVWPGEVAWPDFAGSPAARAYWADAVAAFHAHAPYDGLWIDMNEASNFDTLEAAASFSPYCVNNGGDASPLATCTIPPLARSSDGTPHAFRHNLYGLAEAVATVAGLTAALPSHRPFTLSRSTFLGAGAFAAHWTGDNNSSWADLGASIPGVLAAGLAGIPLAGADVCGFAGAADADLCAAWTAAAAWLPLLRNHAAIDSPPQEPWRWPAVAAVARRGYGARYAVLPLFYSLLAAASATGAPVARPLWMLWPASPAARAAEGAWMLGESVFVAPPLTREAVAAGAVDVWLPPARWCDAWGLLETVQSSNTATATCHTAPADTGRTLRLASSPASPALLLAAGAALAASSPALAAWHADGGAPEGPPPVRAQAAVTGAVTVVAVVDGDGTAVGRVYIDDGLTHAAGGWADLDVARGKASVRPAGGVRLPRPLQVTRLVVVPVAAQVARASARGATVAGWRWANGTLTVDVRAAVVQAAADELVVEWEGGGEREVE